MNSYSKTGRAGLVRDLMAKGLSVRNAEKVVNAVFEVITRAIRRGEVVETPLGTLQVKTRNVKRRQEIHTFRNVNTGKRDLKLVVYGKQRRGVKLTPNESLDLTAPPRAPPPPTLTTEQIESRQLAADLLGRPVDNQVMVFLERAAAFPPQRVGNLDARLRDLKSRGPRFTDADQLAAAIAQLYWL
jgi:nucleoid DNA-binding protein